MAKAFLSLSLSPKMGLPVQCAAKFCRWPGLWSKCHAFQNFSSSLITWLPAKFRNACWRSRLSWTPRVVALVGEWSAGQGLPGHILAPFSAQLT